MEKRKLFNVSDYEVIHIKTAEEAKRIAYLTQKEINWEVHQEGTCFRINQGICLSLDFCKDHGYFVYDSTCY